MKRYTPAQAGMLHQGLQNSGIASKLQPNNRTLNSQVADAERAVSYHIHIPLLRRKDFGTKTK
jgi:hypothetical protein